MIAKESTWRVATYVEKENKFKILSKGGSVIVCSDLSMSSMMFYNSLFNYCCCMVFCSINWGIIGELAPLLSSQCSGWQNADAYQSVSPDWENITQFGDAACAVAVNLLALSICSFPLWMAIYWWFCFTLFANDRFHAVDGGSVNQLL